MLLQCRLYGSDELRSERRDYGVSVASEAQDAGFGCIERIAAMSHSTGRPINQRGNAGLSWPGFAVPAGEPLAGGPEVS